MPLLRVTAEGIVKIELPYYVPSDSFHCGFEIVEISPKVEYCVIPKTSQSFFTVIWYKSNKNVESSKKLVNLNVKSFPHGVARALW